MARKAPNTTPPAGLPGGAPHQRHPPWAPGSGKRGTRATIYRAGQNRWTGPHHLAAADPAPAGQRGRASARCVRHPAHQRLDAAADAAQGECAHDRQFGTAGGAVADLGVIGDGNDETLRHGHALTAASR
jgi:hypothetical protein